jgi:vancomycin resistance protein YoaR
VTSNIGRALAARFGQHGERVKHWFRRPWSRFELVMLLPCIALLVVTALGTERLRTRGHVLPGVVLGGVEVSGFSESALRGLLEARRREVMARVLRIRVGDLEFPTRGEELGASVDVSGLVELALSRGRSGNLLEQFVWRARRFASNDELELVPSFDRRAWHEHVMAFERAALETPQEGGLSFAGGKITRREPAAGQMVRHDVADERLSEALRVGARAVELPTSTRIPVTTSEAVDEVEEAARRLLAGSIRLRVVWPPELPMPEEFANSEREVVLDPKRLWSALQVREVGERPTRLELVFDNDALARALDEVKKRWERPSRDARFVVDRRNAVSIEPSTIGTSIDFAALATAILAAPSNARWAELRLVPAEPPRVSTELAHKLGVRGLVSQFTTHHPCCRPRVANIHRIADLVNGTIVLPGETFSLNALVGPRSRANGFEPAPTIVHGEIKDTFGGGISQFTTTLFNAVLDGGYQIVERQPHSFYFPRYPIGHEATLSFPKPDFMFKNDSAFGVVLITEYSGTFIRVKVFGDNEGRRSAREVSPRFDFVEPRIEYVSDDRIAPGESKLIERGSRGFSVNVSRTVTFSDGRKDTQSRKVTYEPRPRVVGVHSCEVPEGEEGHTGEECPELELLDGGVSAPP